LQFLIDYSLVKIYRPPEPSIYCLKATCQLPGAMHSIVNFVELENRVISATYRNLMIKAKVILVEKASGQQLPDPVTTISSPLPIGALRIRLPEAVKPGVYFLRALNAHGDDVARSAEFRVG
jgi:hypothetical protein